jgi:hypothetical protein
MADPWVGLRSKYSVLPGDFNQSRITVNVSVLYKARDLMIWMQPNPLRGPLERVVPKKTKQHIKNRYPTLVLQLCDASKSVPNSNGPQMEGPKSPDVSGSTPSNGPRNGWGGGRYEVYLLRIAHTPLPPALNKNQQRYVNYQNWYPNQ